jgi:hypothetical protein
MLARIVALGLISLHIAQAIVCYDGVGFVVTPKGCPTGRCATITNRVSPSHPPIRACDNLGFCTNILNKCANLTQEDQMCCCNTGDLCNGFNEPWPSTECYSGDGQDQNNWSSVSCNAGWCARREDSNQQYTRFCDTSDLCPKGVGNDCLTLANGSIICCCNDKKLCNGHYMTTTLPPTTPSTSTLPPPPTIPPTPTSPAPPFQCYVGSGFDSNGWSRQECTAKLCFKEISNDKQTVARGCAMNGCTISAQMFCESYRNATTCCCGTSLCNGALKSASSGVSIILVAVFAAVLVM